MTMEIMSMGIRITKVFRMMLTKMGLGEEKT